MRAVKARMASITWRCLGRLAPAYSRLFLVSDGADWSLREDMRQLGRVTEQLGIASHICQGLNAVAKQATFHSSQFVLLNDDLDSFARGRVGVAYFHGVPGSGDATLDRCYHQLCRHHHHLDRVWVSHNQMRDAILDSGIDPAKVFLIRIGIDIDTFTMQSPQSRQRARLRYGLPESAVVVGSFQKDGVGWQEGNEPKLIKGPDVFLKTIEILKERVNELHVLLSGPARGYVKAGLQRLGVPHQHHYVRSVTQVAQLYQALDAYVVSSRQEGGPKAVLEAMASGVPLITTRVGQAADLVQHGVNGWLCAVEDAQALAHHAEEALSGGATQQLVRNARQLAQDNSYQNQLPQWRSFMDGFVQMSKPDAQ